MKRAAVTHATHDELLLARLYGGDVDEQERSRALDQMASCLECADVFADLGAIATATAALPIPPRPRDFTLTEADVERLGKRSIRWSMFGWLGRSRALGGSMVAAGLVGVMLVGAVSALAPAAGSGGTGKTSVAAPVSGGNESAYGLGSPSPAHDLTDAGARDGGDTPVAATSPVFGPPAATPGPTDKALLPVPSPLALGPSAAPGAQQSGSGEGVFGSNDDGQGGIAGAGSTAAPAAVPSVGTTTVAWSDARVIALAGFAGLAILGLLLLTVPRLAARRVRR